MKAAIVQRPGELTVQDVANPVVGDYDVLCDLLFGATCTGTDQHLIAGRFPWPVSYPTVLGHESVGRAVEVGNKVRHFRVGDLITRVGLPPDPDGGFAANWGGFAELGIARDHWAMQADGLPASTWAPYRINQVIPPDIDPRDATMMITWRETLSYLSRVGIPDRGRVLIVGSGGNGLAFAAHAVNAGASLVAMVGSPSRRTSGAAVGVTDYINYLADTAVDQAGAAAPDGYDVVIDAVGQAASADGVLPLLKPDGTLGIYGVDDWHNAQIHPLRARGSFALYNGGYDEAEVHQAVIAMMRDGRLQANVWLDGDGAAGCRRVYPLDSIHEAFEAVRTRKCVKTLVKLTTD